MDLLKQYLDTRIVLNSELKEMCFIGMKGGYCHEGGLNNRFKKLCAKIELPEDLHIHSLRHTATALMINSDIPTKVISEQLGHANTVITVNLSNGHTQKTTQIRRFYQKIKRTLVSYIYFPLPLMSKK